MLNKLERIEINWGNKIKFLLIFLITLDFIVVIAQDNLSNLIKQANQLAKATEKKNIKTIVGFTYPKIIELAGGIKELTNLIKSNYQNSDFEIMEVKNGTAGKMYQAGDEIHCLIPQNIVMKTKGGTAFKTGYMLAVSKDKGQNWYFIDANNLVDINKRKKILPKYNPDLKIPTIKAPLEFPIDAKKSNRSPAEVEARNKELDVEVNSIPKNLTFGSTYIDTTVKINKPFMLTYNLGMCDIEEKDCAKLIVPKFELPTGIIFITDNPSGKSTMGSKEGKLKFSKTFFYSLKATKIGNFKIAPIQFELNNIKVYSPEININVIK